MAEAGDARWRTEGFGGVAGAMAAQDITNARHQFARLERFGQVVIGAHFEADDAIDRVAARR